MLKSDEPKLRDDQSPEKAWTPGTNAVVFGRKGSGKTTLVRTLSAHPSFKRVLIVDPLHEYGAAAVVVSGPEELAEYLERTKGRWRIAYQNDHIEDDFDSLCVAAYELGDLLFVVEEADLFCSPTYISGEFYKLIVYGRHRKAAVLTVSRVPADVHRTITRQAWEIYCFTTQEPNDLDYLRRYVGADFAEGVQQLGPHEHRYMNLWDRSGDVTEEQEEDEREEQPAAAETDESPNNAP